MIARERVGNTVVFAGKPLAVFSNAKGDVVCGMHSCCFQSYCSLNGVIVELAEVCLAQQTFQSSAEMTLDDVNPACDDGSEVFQKVVCCTKLEIGWKVVSPGKTAVSVTPESCWA